MKRIACALALAAGCSSPGGSPPVESAAKPAATPAPAPDPAQVEAEKRARAAWFGFELATVGTEFGGDWIAFYERKKADEDALAARWEEYAAEHSLRFYKLRSPEAVRGHRVLHQEFEQVARARTDEMREVAGRALAAIAAGKLDEAARECVFYSGEERDTLCRKRLESNAAALARAAALYDPKVGFDRIELEPPDPATGMVGQARLSFGPAVPPPPDAGERYPSRHQVELWWSGQVMPEANGPVHPAPLDPAAADGHWRFYDLVLPYSLEPSRPL